MRKMSYKKIAAFVLAGTMAIGMSATALAAGGVSTSTGEADVSSINITKKVETDGNTYAPNYTFEFSVTPGPTGDYDGNKVTAGKEGDVNVTGATFTSGTDVKDEYTATGSLSFDVRKYEKPGVYSYTVKESDVDYEGIDKDDSSYTVYVYVANKANGKEYYISNVVSTKDNDDNTKEDITFKNDYGKTNGKVHSVTIKKVVKGNQADLTKKFDFSLNMTGGEDGETYKVVTPSGDQSITTGGNISGIKMGNNDTITVYGLTESDVYNVAEANYDSEGYKTYVDAQSGNETRETTGNGKETKTRTFYNIKEATTPTGIIMSYAPYIAMLAAACILAVVFFNRRREDA